MCNHCVSARPIPRYKITILSDKDKKLANVDESCNTNIPQNNGKKKALLMARKYNEAFASKVFS